jgi:hypothetical protein
MGSAFAGFDMDALFRASPLYISADDPTDLVQDSHMPTRNDSVGDSNENSYSHLDIHEPVDNDAVVEYI